MRELIGVYGTLKRGHGNHSLIRHAPFHGTSYLKDVGVTKRTGFPFAYRSKGAKTFIEIYEVNKATLSAVDRLEGHPHWYKRELFNVAGKDVWVYLNQAEEGNYDLEESGVWS